MIKIRFKKLYQVLDEGDYCNAIVCYVKVPIEVKSECYGEKCKSIIIEWVNKIRIDLWLFQIQIEIKNKKN